MQNAFVGNAANSQGAYDRARGGKIEIKLTIPSQKYNVSGGIGSVVTREMKVTVEIDVELLPLVNVAGYSIEEQQVGPPILEYPEDAVVIRLDESFAP